METTTERHLLYCAEPTLGAVGYDAAIDRPGTSRRPTCRSGKYTTRAAAIAACMHRIERERVKIKESDTIATNEWQGSGDSWQIELSKMVAGCERVTVAAARLIVPFV